MEGQLVYETGEKVGRIIEDYYADPEPVMIDVHVKHYGVREPAAGWLADSSDFIFCTTNRKLAWAQAAHLWSRPGYSKLWHVVCIEDWVDEQQIERPTD